MQDCPKAVAGLPLGPLQRDLMEAHLSRDTAEDKRQSAIADQRLTPADGIIDHPSGMLTANYAPVDTYGRSRPNEQQLVLASLDRAQARVVPTRSGQRQQLSLGWEGRKPLDTE